MVLETEMTIAIATKLITTMKVTLVVTVIETSVLTMKWRWYGNKEDDDHCKNDNYNGIKVAMKVMIIVIMAARNGEKMSKIKNGNGIWALRSGNLKKNGLGTEMGLITPSGPSLYTVIIP